MPPPILLTWPREAGPRDLDAYRSGGGYRGLAQVLEAGDPAGFRDEVTRSGLRGRGGARFPVGVKWALAADAAADQKFVVANGGEHEPGSDKDKFLVEHDPHAVLEGMALCAFATGASKGWLYLIEDMAGPLASAERAIAEARAAGLLGNDILGSGFAFDVELHRAPTTYVAGEETAALDSIEGGPGKPRKKPPYPGEAGIQGKPTTVNNTETMAHVAFIAREGPDAFAAVGTEHSKGTMLLTLPDAVENPGVYELPFGSTYRELIEGCGGGLKGGKTLRAFLPALSSGWLGADRLDTPICYEGMKEFGSSPGCGGVHILAEGEDPMERTLEIARFFMAEQCGQCAPCRMETNQFVHVLQAARDGKEPAYDAKLRKLAAFARGKGHCSLIEMAAAPVLSALDVFGDELVSR